MSDGDADHDLLMQRARALAVPQGPSSAPVSGAAEILVFKVRRATYAVATQVVRNVRKVERMSPVPRGVGLAGLGVIDGEIVPFVRLDSVGPTEVGAAAGAVPLVVVLGRAKPELGLLADEIVGVRSGESAGGDEGGSIVHLDGVALLRSRTR